MRERLFIQFNGDEPVQCQLMDGNGQPAAGRYRGGLADMGAFSDNRQVVVVVPSEAMLFYRPEVPRASSSRLRQALPYLLEDNLLEPPGHYHFAMGRRDEQGHMPVVVMPAARIQEWQQAFEQADIRPSIMVPEVLCLPWQEGQWTLFLENERVILRYGSDTGLVTEWESLPLLMATLAAQQPLSKIVAFAERPEAFEARLQELQQGLSGFDEVEWTSHSLSLFDLCLHNFDEMHAINLLQGPYKSRREFNRQLGPWRMAAALMLGLLLLWGVDYLLGYWRLSHELGWLDGQITAEIHQGFPEIKTIRQPLNQVNVALSQLRGQSSSSEFSKLMAATGQALQGSNGTLQELHYRDSQLIVVVQFPDLQTVNNFEQALQGQAGVAVKVLSANKKDDAVLARIQVSGGGA